VHTVSQPSILPTPFHEDGRGVFSKPLSDTLGTELDFHIKELFWTTSSRGVIRGMHFQVPPAGVNKLVWVTAGTIIDVVLDLRDHEGYGTVTAFELDASSGSVWIPAGFAHGFQTLSDEDALVNYAVDYAYVPECDTGIRWDSIGYDWPLPVGPISDRDRLFPGLSEFVTPFPADA
jgi:dTDP-4-dehydrorhamnose 3,5-epimerase